MSTMPYFSLTRAPLLSSLLKYEVDPNYSRETATVLAGSGAARKLVLGNLIGLVTLGAAVATPGTNTGNGTISAVTTRNGAKVGTYSVVFTAATKFDVSDPDGFRIASGTTGVAYADDLGFTITAGGTAFVAGDSFAIAVAGGSKKAKAWTPGAADGSQIVAGVALVDAEAADGVDAVSALVYARRGAVIASNAIVWPAGATDNEKAAAIAALDALTIVVR